MVRETFLPCIFFRNTKSLSPIVGALSTMLINKSVLGLLNPVTSVKEKYLSSHQESAELVRSVTGVGALSDVDHLLALREERRDCQNKLG